MINLLSAVFVGKGDGYRDIIWQLFFAMFFANCTIKAPAIVTKLSAQRQFSAYSKSSISISLKQQQKTPQRPTVLEQFLIVLRS